MYSYLHRFHAGCFADVHKHIALIAILKHLQKKETPFCVMDSHAGEGITDLLGEESQKTLEYQQGIAQLMGKENLPSLAQDLVDLVYENNVGNDLKFYPGSPLIIRHFLREQDQAIFIEHHPMVIQQLKRNLGKSPRCHIHDRDTNEAIKALVPFAQKRGLVFIDPSFEVKTEYTTIVEVIKAAHAKFSQGIFALWYPLLPAGLHVKMLQQLKKIAGEKILVSEWVPNKQNKEGLYGSGMIIINPPWQLAEQLRETLKQLNTQIFTSGYFE